jgi:YggT family protein
VRDEHGSMSLEGFLLRFVDVLFFVLNMAIILRALLSWFNLPPSNRLVVMLYDITEPVLAPLRRVVPRIGMIDITPIVAILLLEFISSALHRTLAGGGLF